MLVRLLQRFSGIRLRADVHPAAIPPPGAERSKYAVDGCERVWLRSHLTAYAKVRAARAVRWFGAGADGECTLQNGLWVEMDEVAQE